MKIKTFLKALKYKFEYQEHKLITSTLCGVQLKTVSGTVRNAVDQDDAWFFYLAKHHHAIYDIGCNVGYTALLALIQVPDKPFVLVDPNPRALNQAHLNLVVNNLGFKAHYYSGFVSDALDKTIKFYTIGAGEAGSIHASHAKSASAINSYSTVKTVTLDYLYNYYNLKPDLVKIDVEGAETLVMDGAKTLAKDSQCTFFVEMHAVKELSMVQGVQHMLDWCVEMDYKAWYLKTGQELIDTDVIKDRGKCHLLLLPKPEAYPNYLKNISQSSPLPNSI